MKKKSKVSMPGFDVLFTYGDRHAPHQDNDLERILLELIHDVKPDIIIDGGDMISADSLSTFSKNYAQLAGLQAELDEDYRWRMSINSIVPKADKIILKDNHFFRRLEDRKRDNIWTEDLQALQAETLLRLEEVDWKLVTEWSWKEKILFLHGDDKSTNMSAASARNPVNKVRNLVRDYGVSVIRYHTHVTGLELYRRKGEVTMGLQLGTFQDISRTDYLKHKDLVNWTHSAAVIYLPQDGTKFHVVPILFNGKSTVFNGKYYT